MRITYLNNRTSGPVFERGDFVRLLRDEPGDPVAAGAGEWRRGVFNAGPAGMDVRLAGFSCPRMTELPMATGIPASILVPCDRCGLGISLKRDLRQAGGGEAPRALG